ncbi:transcriptional regulator [Leucothrix pacifica]|uniref:Transcriptional regulator n=1 Tax=Leucothrix pacifica TaxID=1247513 RepID=A0A317CIE3_9GAMM|nr:transcriptional regulator [Leucothrix pacifica]PWQ98149.1 transcriptional regulator [Leucothrix pacifica]
MLKAKVKISGRLKKFTRTQTAEEGLYETASEYLCDLIQIHIARQNNHSWTALKKELLPGMNAPRSEFVEVTTADVIARNKR